MIRGSVAIVLQARMASTRLPGKALADIAGTTLVARCLQQLRQAQLGTIVLATTTRDEDTALAAEATRCGVEVFRGEADDVLGRFEAVARRVSAQYIVRATGDNPAVDPGSVLRLVEAARSSCVDHAVESGLPCGCTVEVVTAAALLHAADRAERPDDREHVTTFIKRPESGYRCVTPAAPAWLRRPDLRFTVDTPDDLAYMRRLLGSAERLHPRPTLLDLIVAADCLGRRSEAA